MRHMGSKISSTHDKAYDTLYRQYIHIIPELADVFPKPEPFPEPVQDAPLQRTPHSCHVLPTPSPSTCVALPPLPDLVASTLTAPIELPPAPVPALDLITCALVLPDVTPLMTLPSLLPALSWPKGPYYRLATTMSLALAAPEPICLSAVLPLYVQSLHKVLCHLISVSLPPSARSQSNSLLPSQVCQVL
jgi:hypothetical protein